MWENTKKRLKELELNLVCRICNKIAIDPHILGSCDHFFCRNCIKDHVGKVCPVCSLPSFAVDTSQNHRIAGLVRTCQVLRKIVELQSTDHLMQELCPSTPNCGNGMNDRSISKSTPQTTASVDSDQEFYGENVLIVRNDSSSGKTNLEFIPQAKKSLSTNASTCSSFSPKAHSPAGGIINRRNKKGETPLHIAAIKGRVDEVSRLIKLGAYLNAKDNAGWTALHEACNHGHSEIVKLLLENGASVNIPGFENATPLHDAVNADRLEIVKLLLSHGADPNRRNTMGYTAIDISKADEMRHILLSSEYQQVSKRKASDLPVMTAEFVLLCTGLNDDQKTLLKSFAKQYDAKIVQSFSTEVTHLVAHCSDDDTCPRTLKYLSAVVTGKWIVSFKWIEVSLQCGKVMSEEAFEINGTRQWPKCQGPKRGRLNAHEQNPSLFSGCHFYFSGNFLPPGLEKSDLIQLVRLAGGVVLSREPKPDMLDDRNLTVPFHATVKGPLEHCSYFIIYNPESRKPTSIVYKSKFLKSLPVNWLLDCISKFEIINPE